MRKKIVFFMAMVLLLAIPILASASEYAIVTNGKLNLRQYASTSSASLGRYGTGTWIRILGQPTNGWYPVSTPDGKNGYMYGSYLTFASNQSYGTVKYAQGGYVNLRSGPSLNYPVITQVTSGTAVQILDSSYEWYYVALNLYGGSYQGYMHSSLINSGGGTAVVTTRNGGKVNVRSGPSFNYGSIGSLSSGTTVQVLLRGNSWYWISGGGLTGFMSTTYLSTSGGGGGGTTSVTAYVNNPRSTQILNLREYASQNSRSLGQYRNGTKVKVVNKGSTWCEVYVGTKHGYMMTRYLSFNGTYTPATTVVPYYVPQDSGYDNGYGYSYSGDYGSYQAPTVQQPAAQQPVVQQPTITATPVPIYQATATPVPIVQATATPVPVYQQTAQSVQSVQSTQSVQTAQSTQQSSGTASSASAVRDIQLTASSGTVNVYNDPELKLLKAAYSSGKSAKLLSPGDAVSLVLVDNSVGYVSTASISY